MRAYSLYILLLPVLLIVSSCANPAVSTAEKMRAQACSGNVDKFMAYIDRYAVEDNIKEQAIEMVRKDKDEDKWESFGRKLIESAMAQVMPQLMTGVWDYLRQDVRKAKDGDICNAGIAPTKDKTNTVTLTFPDGDTMYWGFEKTKDSWELVSITDPLLFEKSGSKLGGAFTN